MEENFQRDSVIKEKTLSFPCPTCGANMVFNPESQGLSCPYCNNKVDIKAQSDDIKEYDLLTAKDNVQNWGKEKRVFHCESCGAETIIDENIVAQFCAFCGSSHIVKNDDSPGILPESLVPFKISKKSAEELFKNWIKKRFFAPNKLKNMYQKGKISGVYIPYWTYDADTVSFYTAEAGTYYYETVTEWVEENGKKRMVTRQVRKTRWHFTSGDYSCYFDDVLINASKNMDDKLIEKIEPFNLKELVHYEPQFLSGFLAEKYSIGLKEGWQRAKLIINNGIYSGVVHKIHADEVRNVNIKTSFNMIKYKHLLLPVWISAYTYNKKIYRYLINGQTGEVQGKYPISPWKVLLTVLLAGCLIALIIWLANSSSM